MAEWKIALIGNPNTGKSTLFNALTGSQSRVGNFPGVTVEKKLGRWNLPNAKVDLIDLPGTYSLAPRSPDELISVNVLLGKQSEVGHLDAVICIVDSSNIERNVYLLSQLLDLKIPTLLVLNMWDVAESRGIRIDPVKLEQTLGIPVIPVTASKRRGLEQLASQLTRTIEQKLVGNPTSFPVPIQEEVQRVEAYFASQNRVLPPGLALRLLWDVGGFLESHLAGENPEELASLLKQARARMAESGHRAPLAETKLRYQWAREVVNSAVQFPTVRRTNWTDRIDRILTHRIMGLVSFFLVMLVVFQAIYSWSEPMMAACESVQGAAGDLVSSLLGPGALRSLLVDGIIAGVGAVLVFVPQIAMLFLLIAILEDCGYLARAAFLMDRLMTKFGLSGKSFVPLMSSFACAIPGVMATRTLENRKDRFLTILVAPLMSCSARLPVYFRMIDSFVPDERYLGGWIELRSLVLLFMISLGTLVSIPITWLFRKFLFPGPTPPFILELPSYKLPSVWIVLRRVQDQVWRFISEAGTMIFLVTVTVWGACYFPGDHSESNRLQREIETQAAEIEAIAGDLEAALKEHEEENPEQQVSIELQEKEAELKRMESALEPLQVQNAALQSELLNGSLLGRLGRVMEPVFLPLGWDWRIGMASIASFPAREVIISTMGIIFGLGGEVDEESVSLKEALQAATWPDGRPLFNLAVGCSVMVFFSLCAQCASTLAVIAREMNSWKWAAFVFVYMTLLGYFGALITYQTLRLL